MTYDMIIDVDIEFAHHTTAVIDGEREHPGVRRSAVLARVLTEAFDESGVRWITSVLVDDKSLRPDARFPENLGRSLEAIRSESRAVPISRAMLETTLANMVDDFSKLLAEDRRQSVRATMQAALARDGHLACSQDISIWYALRGGLLGSMGADHGPGPGLGFAEVPRPSVLVSILPSAVQKFERKADKEILQFLSGGCPMPRLRRLFYDINDPIEADVESAREFAARVIRDVGAISPQL